MKINLPSRWDLEADLVAIGSGIGGLSAAIVAHDHGASAMVVERTTQVGGVTALSMGEVWIAGNHHAAEIGVEDSPESGFRYLKRLAMDYGEDDAMANFVLHAPEALKYFEQKINLKARVIPDCPDYYYAHCNDALAAGRMLEVAPFPAQSLGPWRERTRVSPHVPYGMTHADISAGGGTANMMRWDYGLMGARLENDERCLGPGLSAYFVKGALDRGIPIHTGANAEELIGDGARVVGVRVRVADRDVFVKANRGVVVAVSSYERDERFNKTLGQQLDAGSLVFSAIDGANFRLAGPFGARVARVPDISSACFHVPGEEDEEGQPLWRPALPFIGLPHTIVVNQRGRRFGNEAFYRQFYYALDLIDGATQTHPNFPCWLVIDSQARDKYPLGSVTPGQDLPEGFGVKAASLGELAALMGVDADGLSATVRRFNAHAENGQDPDFGRGSHPWSAWICGDVLQQPNPNLGALSKPPFYAVKLRRLGGSAIPAAGLVADHHCRVLGWDDQPIDGLYVAGNSMARMETGAAMQSGISNARGMTHGYLAARHAAGFPSDRLDKERVRFTT